jgi:hypothetical protein
MSHEKLALLVDLDAHRMVEPATRHASLVLLGHLGPRDGGAPGPLRARRMSWRRP